MRAFCSTVGWDRRGLAWCLARLIRRSHSLHLPSHPSVLARLR